MPQWLVKPANQPIVAGDPLRVEMEIGTNATAAAMLAGRLVIADTADGTVKEATTKSKGLIGFLDVDPKKLEATPYAVGDQAMVVQGECFAKLTLLASENVVRGDRLVCAALGKVAKQAVGVLGAQGDIVGLSMEASNVTVDAEILVLFRPTHEPATAS
jgi:hypothetical protein